MESTASITSEASSRESDSRRFLPSIWAGLAKAHSGDLFIIGAHDLTGIVYNLGDKETQVRNATININGFKFGPGLGANIGAVFVLAYGYNESHEMIGAEGGFDFDLALGARLTDLIRSVKGLGKAIDTLEKYKTTTYLAENAIKNMNITSRGIYTIPIPLAGIGLHAWAGFKFGEVRLLRTGIGIA